VGRKAGKGAAASKFGLFLLGPKEQVLIYPEKGPYPVHEALRFI
jgi:hypothetical protein